MSDSKDNDVMRSSALFSESISVNAEEGRAMLGKAMRLVQVLRAVCKTPAEAMTILSLCQAKIAADQMRDSPDLEGLINYLSENIRIFFEQELKSQSLSKKGS